MKHIKTGAKRGEFNILFNTPNAQAAMMTLRPGGVSDEEPSNEHPRSEQWLFVISGSGEASIGKRRGQLRRVKLSENSLLLIEKGEQHQIRNTGRKHLRTLNFYAPPAYGENGEPKGWLERLVASS
jgi:mannose-6-phosphate isomerase-like protein (cupin superfamily)